MILSMGTKLEISEDLLVAAEQAASQRGQTVSDFVEQLLRYELKTSSTSLRERRSLPTFRGQGLRPGVNLDDSAALLELMESSSHDPAHDPD